MAQPLASAEGRAWQARELRARDALFCAFLIASHVLYVAVTVPGVCNEAGGGPAGAQQGGAPASPGAPSLSPAARAAWAAACARLSAPQAECGGLVGWCASTVACGQGCARDGAERANASLPDGPAEGAQAGERRGGCPVSGMAREAASQATRAGRVLLRCSAAFLCCGWLSGDAFQAAIPLLRLGLLAALFCRFPLPNLAALAARLRAPPAAGARRPGSWLLWYRPSLYVERPGLRAWVIVAQRLVPAAAAALSVGRITTSHFWLAGSWLGLTQLVYLGWLAWMLVLPLRLQLLVGTLESLLVWYTAARAQATYLDSAASSLSPGAHLAASLLLIAVLPSLGVAWLERSQQRRWHQWQLLRANQGGSGVAWPAQAKASAGAAAAQPSAKQQLCAGAFQQHSQACCGLGIISNSTLSCQARSPCCSDSACSIEEAAAALAAEVAAAKRGALLRPGSSHAGSSRSTSCCSARSSVEDTALELRWSPGVAGSGPPSSTTSPGEESPRSCSSQDEGEAGAAPGLEPAVKPRPWQLECAASGAGSARCSLSSDGSRGSGLSAGSPVPPAGYCGSSSACQQFLADIAGSLQLAAGSGLRLAPALPSAGTAWADSLAEPAALLAGLARPVGPAAAAAAAAATGGSAWPEQRQAGEQGLVLGDVMPSLCELLDVATMVQPSGPALAAADGLRPYTSLAGSLEVSTKVHTRHSQVASLSPLLNASLAGAAAALPAGGGALHLETLVFPGCVQLVGCVYGLGPDQGSGGGESGWPGDSGGGDGGGSSSSSSWAQASHAELAASLLASVTAGLADSSAGAAGDEEAPGVDVFVAGQLLASRPAGKPGRANAKGQAARPCSPPLAGPKPLGVAQPGSSHGWHCSPAALVAGLAGQELQLGAAPSCLAPGAACRLLVAQSGRVLLDEQALAGGSISARLPALAAGVVHVALLPGAQPSAGGAPGGSAVPLPAPLLLAPVLVLTEPAARELNAAWQAAAGSSSSSSPASAWHACVLPLARDAAFVLGTLAPGGSAAGGGSKQALPANVAVVLRSLLRHLAACGLLEVLRFVVSQLAARTEVGSGGSLAPGAAAAKSSSSGTPQSIACKAAKQPSPAGGAPAWPGMRQLLCGFSEPALESAHAAAAFTSTASHDLLVFVLHLAACITCWAGRGGGAALAHGGWAWALWSVAAVGLLNCGLPACMLLFRARMTRCLQRDCPDPAAASALLAGAARRRQELLAAFVACIVAVNLLCASGAVTMPPVMLRAWASPGAQQTAAMCGAMVVRALVCSGMPMPAFVPLVTAEVLSHVLGTSLLAPWAGPLALVLRYGPAWLLALGLSAALRVAARRHTWLASRRAAASAACGLKCAAASSGPCKAE